MASWVSVITRYRENKRMVCEFLVGEASFWAQLVESPLPPVCSGIPVGECILIVTRRNVECCQNLDSKTVK